MARARCPGCRSRRPYPRSTRFAVRRSFLRVQETHAARQAGWNAQYPAKISEGGGSPHARESLRFEGACERRQISSRKILSAFFSPNCRREHHLMGVCEKTYRFENVGFQSRGRVFARCKMRDVCTGLYCPESYAHAEVGFSTSPRADGGGSGKSGFPLRLALSGVLPGLIGIRQREEAYKHLVFEKGAERSERP